MKRVLITCKQMQDALPVFRAQLEGAGLRLDVPRLTGQQFTEDKLIEMLQGVEGIIAGDDPLTARVLNSTTDLRAIAKWGIGTDGIDFAAADECGIVVSNTPGVFGDDVADVAMGYVVMLARGLKDLHDSVAAGGWTKLQGRRLAGATIGILGLGSIGHAVARRALAFGMTVGACDPFLDRADGIELVEMDRLFADHDFIVLCAPLTAETEHAANERTLSLVRPGTFLVNVSRGPLVDERALIGALRDGRIAAAALDVFEVEPLPLDSALRRHPRCIFGTHNGSNTREGVLQASAVAVANILRDLGT